MGKYNCILYAARRILDGIMPYRVKYVSNGSIAFTTQTGGTVESASPFEPTKDADLLQQALKGLGTDEETIIDILTRRTSLQRQQIIKQYKLAYDGDLVNDLKDDLHGKFEDVIVAIMTPLPEYLAHELHRAVRGRGVDERTFVEIFCSNDNETIRSVKIAYHQHYGKTLDVAVKSENSDDFQMFLEDLVWHERDEEDISVPNLPARVAKQLYAAAGEGRIKTDKDELRRIFTAYSYDTLRSVFLEYRELSGRPLDEVLKIEVSGELLKGLLAAYYCILDPSVFFAHELHSSMEGFGTRDHCLIRLVVTRCEIDMNDIKTEYKKIFGRSLKKDIKGDTHGDYRKILLTLIDV